RLRSDLDIKNPDITIAGQTAPGDGICIAEYPFTISADNVIIRFMRFRPGNKNITEEMAASGACDGWDGLGAIDRKDIIVDHCSVSWSIDECLSFVGCSRTTVQWCIVTQSLVKGHSKLSHGYGGNWGGRKASYHHNLLAHHTSRAPRLGPRPTTQLKEQMDMRNNVIYNYSGEECYGGEGMKVNIVNNLYIPGPGNAYWSGSRTNKQKRIAGVGVRNKQYVATYPDYAPALHLIGKYYVDGNYNFSHADIYKDNWTNGIYSQITWSDWDDLANTAAKQEEMKKEIKAETPIEYVYTTTHDHLDTWNKVCSYAGASLHRDELDTTIANEAKSKTSQSSSPASTGSGLGKGFINTQDDVKGLTGGDGWPKLNAGTAKVDTDGDGIPDEWEKANKLDPNDPTDGAKITADGYSNLEHYINSLVQDIVNKGNAGTSAKMLNGTLTYADAAVQLPAYDPNYVPEPDPDDEVTPGPGDEEEVGNSWTANGTEPANKTVVRENITAEFLDNTSKGSNAGAGTWDFSNAKDVRGDQNGLEIKFSPNVPGTLKIVFAATVANNKSINMFVNGDTNATLDATLSDGTVVKSGGYAPKGVEADDYISYELEAGKTYNYYTSGTKWRIRSFEFIPGDLSGIEDIITDSETSTGNGKIYNLMGIEVKGNLAPGVYIRDGKKFLVK
ncbi:MAG: thrombospondin type 3 repeat-containing protein, partial [Duncaniella sp.]|nr:thrombospondin type 3 repeat-containing protein [Duncaniella sp.]